MFPLKLNVCPLAFFSPRGCFNGSVAFLVLVLRCFCSQVDFLWTFIWLRPWIFICLGPSGLLLAPRSRVRALVLLLGCPGTCMITGESNPHLVFQVLDRLRRQVDFLSQRVDRLEQQLALQRRLGTCEPRHLSLPPKS